MLAAANGVEARTSEIVEAITSEMGGPSAWGRYNVKVLTEKLSFAADCSYHGLTGEVIPSENPSRTMIAIPKPAGVVVSIVPWNSPALLVGASVPAALVLGNTLVIKASEQTPRTHCLVAACFADAGFPAGVVNLLTNAPENAHRVVEALIAHPACAAFTLRDRRASAASSRKKPAPTSNGSCLNLAAKHRASF